MVNMGDHSTVIYGTHFPTRVFVGCLPSKATAKDLADFFQNFGSVSEAKVVFDDNGGSKRYGFVSFEKEDDVKFVLNQGTIFFWGKKINVGPAVKKKLYDDVKGTPAAIVFNQAEVNAGCKSHSVYQPMESFQMQITKTAAAGPMIENFSQQMEFQPWGYMPPEGHLNDIYQMPYYATLPPIPCPMSPIMPSQPYPLISPKLQNNSLPACSYAMPSSSSPPCGPFSSPISPSSTSCNFTEIYNTMHYTNEKILAMSYN